MMTNRYQSIQMIMPVGFPSMAMSPAMAPKMVPWMVLKMTSPMAAKGPISCLLYTSLPFSWHTANSTGEIIQRCTSDVEVIRGFVTNQCLEVFRTVFLVSFYFVIMFSMNVKISLVALLFLPIIAGYSGFFYSRIARRFLAADEAEGELTTTAQELSLIHISRVRRAVSASDTKSP